MLAACLGCASVMTQANEPAPALKPSVELGVRPAAPAEALPQNESAPTAPLDLRIERAVTAPPAAPTSAAPKPIESPTAAPAPSATSAAEPAAAPVAPPAVAQPPTVPTPSAAARSLDPRRPITRAPVQVGDIWAYLRNVAGSEPTVIEQQVVNVNKDGISLKNQLRGAFDSQTNVYSREWNLLASGFSDYEPALAYYSFSLYPGKKWRVVSSLRHVGQRDQVARVVASGEVLDWEEIEVPAGKFLTLKVRVLIEAADPGEPDRTFRTEEFHWYAREVMRPVRVSSVTTATDGKPTAETIELVAFRLSDQ